MSEYTKIDCYASKDGLEAIAYSSNNERYYPHNDDADIPYLLRGRSYERALEALVGDDSAVLLACHIIDSIDKHICVVERIILLDICASCHKRTSYYEKLARQELEFLGALLS